MLFYAFLSPWPIYLQSLELWLMILNDFYEITIKKGKKVLNLEKFQKQKLWKSTQRFVFRAFITTKLMADSIPTWPGHILCHWSQTWEHLYARVHSIFLFKLFHRLRKFHWSILNPWHKVWFPQWISLRFVFFVQV